MTQELSVSLWYDSKHTTLSLFLVGHSVCPRGSTVTQLIPLLGDLYHLCKAAWGAAVEIL